MSLRLFLLERHVPAPIRRRMFGRLVGLTANAFGVPAPDLSRLRLDEAIERFARFTRDETERTLAVSPSSDECRDRLFDGARELGSSIRRSLGVRGPDEAMRALRLLYAAIGITLDVRGSFDICSAGLPWPERSRRHARVGGAKAPPYINSESARCCDTGEIVITRCAFSRVYAPAICEFISALDAGIVAGLTGGTTLVFTERITAGAPACRARLIGSEPE